MRKIKVGLEARKGLASGIHKLRELVGSTLGPNGKLVVLSQKITKDGVSVAREVHFPDEAEQEGANILKEVAIKVEKTAGDGTTSSVILADNMIQDSLALIENDPKVIDVKLRKEILEASKRAAELLPKFSKEVSINDTEKLKQIAYISSNGDKDMSGLVVKALQEAGDFGVVDLIRGPGLESVLEVTDGFVFPSGYGDPHFILDRSRGKLTFENPKILVYDGEIDFGRELMEAFEEMRYKYNGRPFLIFCQDVVGEAKVMMLENHLQGIQHSCFVPASGLSRLENTNLLQDVAMLTGATYLNADLNPKLERVVFEDVLGDCDKVVMSSDNSKVVKGNADKKSVKEQISQLKVLMDECDDTEAGKAKKEDYRQRLGRLYGKASVIKIGSHTESEFLEKRDRFEDSVEAVRSALEEGYVPGGGTTYYRISYELYSGELTTGGKIFADALQQVIYTILNNGGMDSEEVSHVLEQLLENDNAAFDAREDVVVPNAVESGIIDPTKVIRVCMEEAAALAALLINCNGYSLQLIPEHAKTGNHGQ